MILIQHIESLCLYPIHTWNLERKFVFDSVFFFWVREILKKKCLANARSSMVSPGNFCIVRIVFSLFFLAINYILYFDWNRQSRWCQWNNNRCYAPSMEPLNKTRLWNWFISETITRNEKYKMCVQHINTSDKAHKTSLFPDISRRTRWLTQKTSSSIQV